MKQNLVLSVDLGATESDPITIDEAKSWLRVDGSEDDSLITALITTARQQLEHYLNISLMERTVKARIENGLGEMPLPYGPVKEVTSVKDRDGNAIETSAYTLHGDLFKTISFGSYPNARNNFYDPGCYAVTVTYEAGYESLPQYFITAIKQQVAWLYQNRGDAELASQLAPVVIVTMKPHRRVF